MRAVYKAIGQIAVALPVLCAPTALMAQEIGGANSIVINPQLDRSDAAGARNEPEFEPQPLRAGPFILQPSLSVVGGYNSNVLNSANELSDAVLTITPRLTARADTPLHLFEVTATGFIRRFASFETENSEEFNVASRSRYDFTEESSLFANASYSQNIEPRSSFTANPNAAEPVSYTNTAGQVGATIGLGSLELRPSVSLATRDYSTLDLIGGGSADLSFRDSRRLGGSLSVGYRVSPMVSVFAAGNVTDVESRNPLPGLDRGAQDLSLVGGVRGELTPVLSGEVAVGYRKREYDLALFRDFGGLTYRADLQYFPTQLLTIRLQAQQVFQNSGNVQVAGILSNRFTVTAYYDPLRNVRVSAQAGYEINDFREADTDASRPSVRIAGEYRFNPNVSVGAYAGVLRQDVSGVLALQEFTSFSAGFGVTLTP